MDVPQPKKLIVCEQAYDHTFFIYAEGEGRLWVEREAPKFGRLVREDDGFWMWFPRQTYDITEVKSYLENMGQVEFTDVTIDKTEENSND